MADLSSATNDELATEMSRRNAMPSCKCQRWQTYMGIDGYTLRCHGCLRAIGRCTCG